MELGPGTRIKMNLPETGMTSEGSQLSRDPRGPPTSRRTPK
jgi:hypothetical protein